MLLKLYMVIKAYKCAELLEFQSCTVVAAKLHMIYMMFYSEKMQSICKEKEYISVCLWSVIQYCLLPVGCAGSEAGAQLCEKAKHHSASVCKVDGHLARQGDDSHSTERYSLYGCVVPLLILMSNTDTKAGCSQKFLCHNVYTM